jgi:organic hydroperoxide reductase OsmC/OhrA
VLHKRHQYNAKLRWTGNRGTGTSHYRAYGRDHEISGDGKTIAIPASSTPVFRGDEDRYNPEELMIGALSGCHMLWFLHLCAEAGIVVTSYEDDAQGTMEMNPDGSGNFTEVVLHPRVQYDETPPRENIDDLHHRAHELCFIARSVNFPVRCEPEY